MILSDSGQWVTLLRFEWEWGFGEGEWKVRQHGADRRRVWRKLHLAADSATHEILCADLSLSGTTDAQALPGLINQTHRKIREVSADGAYDARYSQAT